MGRAGSWGVWGERVCPSLCAQCAHTRKIAVCAHFSLIRPRPANLAKLTKGAFASYARRTLADSQNAPRSPHLAWQCPTPGKRHRPKRHTRRTSKDGQHEVYHRGQVRRLSTRRPPWPLARTSSQRQCTHPTSAVANVPVAQSYSTHRKPHAVRNRHRLSGKLSGKRFNCA